MNVTLVKRDRLPSVEWPAGFFFLLFERESLSMSIALAFCFFLPPARLTFFAAAWSHLCPLPSDIFPRSVAPPAVRLPAQSRLMLNVLSALLTRRFFFFFSHHASRCRDTGFLMPPPEVCQTSLPVRCLDMRVVNDFSL